MAIDAALRGRHVPARNRPKVNSSGTMWMTPAYCSIDPRHMMMHDIR